MTESHEGRIEEVGRLAAIRTEKQAVANEALDIYGYESEEYRAASLASAQASKMVRDYQKHCNENPLARASK